jgi:hypothetical protein
MQQHRSLTIHFMDKSPLHPLHFIARYGVREQFHPWDSTFTHVELEFLIFKSIPQQQQYDYRTYHI